jgi:hypothetical protein
LGLALLLSRIHEWRPAAARIALALSSLAVVLVAWLNLPHVVAITRDRSVEDVIAIADQAANPERPTVLMILWGHNYWGAAYAQEYRGQLEGLTLVDHNAPFRQIVAEGNALVTLSETFHLRPVAWWENKLGPVYLRTYAPGLIEIRTAPRIVDMETVRFPVNDDLSILSCRVVDSEEGYLVRIRWVAETNPERDYSVAVHLVSADPPAGPADILAQADSLHPVEGWYPTTRWEEGQVVQGMYRLPESTTARPAAIRITAYYVDEDGQFVNGEWLSIGLE